MTIREYHWKTGYIRGSISGHFLDWENKPSLYKKYPYGLERIALPKDLSLPQDLLSEVINAKPEDPHQVSMTMDKLSLILLLAYTITSRARFDNQLFHYRSVPSAGALYPCELYVALESQSGIEPGLFHYSIKDHSITRLRKGSLLSYLKRCLDPLEGSFPVITFFITTIFLRSSWKYRDRAYRYHLLDCGHLLEALVLALKALRLPLRVDYDFDDEKTNALLGIDRNLEVCLAIVRVWGKANHHGESEVDPIKMGISFPEASRVSRREVDYPLIREIHESTSRIITPSIHISEISFFLGLKTSNGIAIQAPEKWPEIMSYAKAVMNRRSRRKFIKKEMKKDLLYSLLTLLSKGMQESERPHHGSICVGLLSGHVDDLEKGFYLFDLKRRSLRFVEKGHFLDRMAHACLDQEWLGNASIHFLFLTNLEILERAWGPRGYRYAMINAGRLGHRIYLGATAMGLGSCGIGAFYDREAAQLLGLNDRSCLLYLVAAGIMEK